MKSSRHVCRTDLPDGEKCRKKEMVTKNNEIYLSINLVVTCPSEKVYILRCT